MKSLVFVLLTMLFWGMAPIFGKLGVTKSDPLFALALRSFIISAILLFVILAKGSPTGLLQFDVKSAVFIAIEGVFASLIGHLFYYYSLKYGQITWVVPMIAAYPLVTVLSAYLFLRESLTLVQLAGAILIVAGVILIKQ